MNKKLQLTIAEPCHENWENMSPVEKGKFCGSCQKQVVDFTHMSDRQVAEFFKKPSTGSVCGRFMSDQLDRDINIPKKRIPWLKYFFGILLPALFVSKASAQKIGKAVVHATKDTVRTPITSEFRTLGMVLPKEIMVAEKDKKEDLITKNDAKPVLFKTTINGIVADEKGEPIPFASITTGVIGFGAIADEHGVFSLSIKSLSKDSILRVSSVGYKNADVRVDINDANDSKLIINLKSDNEMDSVIINCRPSVIMGAVAHGVTIIKTDKPANDIIAPINEPDNKISVYPNPVISGNDLTVQWNKTEEGYYAVQLLNLSGQQVHKKEIWIDADARLLDVEVPRVAAGNYLLVFTNKRSGKKYTEKIIVQ